MQYHIHTKPLQLTISHWVNISDSTVRKDGKDYQQFTSTDELYRSAGYTYPKYFKMDVLCKHAWIGTEYLLHCDNDLVYNLLDKEKIGVILATSYGCLEADKQFNTTLTTIPSPAVFVYTLPNIMLGEICIRHGFKGEQFCIGSAAFDANEIHFLVTDLLENRNMDACLCGWANVTASGKEVSLFWITKTENGKRFTPAALQELYKN